MCYNERHPLLPKCLNIFPMSRRMVKWAPERIYNPHMVHMVLFLWKIANKFHAKYQLLGTLSAKVMGHCAARRGSCCSLSVAQPSLDVQGWSEKLVKASTSTLLSITCRFYWNQVLTFMQYFRFRVLLSSNEMGWCARRRNMHCWLSVS